MEEKQDLAVFETYGYLHLTGLFKDYAKQKLMIKW